MTVDQDFAAELAAARVGLLEAGYRDLVELRGLTVGARVRHVGEQYYEARRHGTGVIRVLMEKAPSAWAQTWGRRDIELLVEADKPRFGNSRLGQWADYHTALVTTCYWCDRPVRADGSCCCAGKQGAATAPWAMSSPESGE